MTDDPLLGRQLDEYRLEAFLGQGGMARVYRAVDVRLGRYAAIKVIDTPFQADADYVRRFEREAQAIAQLDHPHIVRLYRYGEAEGVLYMAMQYVEGADLGSVLASYRQDGEFIEPDEARRIIREVCLALDYAHSKGVIHRDVKPANILLDKQGRAILGDFGLALLTEVGTRGEIFGSPAYIAPEQAISSAKAVPQSDLYAVGIILYEMFTGQVPFHAKESLDVALLHINEPPRPPHELRPEVSPELEAIILKALAKKPDARYPTGAALAAALDQALQAKATLLAPPRPLAAHQTIAQRVALELGDSQLPPLPAAIARPASRPVGQPVAAGQIPAAISPASPVRRRPVASYLLASGGIVLSLFVLCGLVMAGWALMSSRSGEAGRATEQASVTEVSQSATQAASSTSMSDTPLPLVQASSTPISSNTPNQAASLIPTSNATPLPQPTATAITYELLMVRGADENSLVVVNQSAAAFPIPLLRFEGEESELEGTAWGIAQIESGQCVTAWKSRGRHVLPGGLTCEIAGEQLVRGGKDRFWKETFDVYYNGQRIMTCRKEQTQCFLILAP